MKYDMTKVEEMLLALLGVFEFESGRVWKRYDFSIMDALHEKELITQPWGKRESVHLTDEGLRRAKELAARHFGIDADDGQSS